MKLCDLRPGLGARKKRKRVGRGISAGQGRTCGRGQKGQKSRGSGTVARGFEGGQTPLHRRLPKLRGTSNQARNIGVFRHRYAVVNVGDLARFEAGAEITPEALKAAGVVKKLEDGLKVLGQGELRVNLVVKAHAFSASAEEKIKAAGGTVEVIV